MITVTVSSLLGSYCGKDSLILAQIMWRCYKEMQKNKAIRNISFVVHGFHWHPENATLLPIGKNRTLILYRDLNRREISLEQRFQSAVLGSPASAPTSNLLEM